MFKVVALMAIVALATAADEAADGEESNVMNVFRDFVPQVSSLCKATCPTICQLLETFCADFPPLPSCEETRTECDSACSQTCECVDECGEDCDKFEQNCAKIGLPLVPNVFCPVYGGMCDVGCVGTCPQRTMLRVITKVTEKIGVTAQAFSTMVIQRVHALFPKPAAK